jgi:mannose-1-phosphate guanylyltransferase
MEKIVCLIMAGGSGTRFWPRSRVAKPKQYLDIAGSESLLQSTVNRFFKVTDHKDIYIVSGKSQSDVLEGQMTMIPKSNLIYEPVGRNTLPCIGLAAMLTERENRDAVMVVTPSDHLIADGDLFRETIQSAVAIAEEKNGIVTIGITPGYPATGYGYIKTAGEMSGEQKIRGFNVERFVEKPDEPTARTYLEQGGYYWNSGMFIFKISVFIEAMKQFAPELYSNLKKIQAELGKPTFEQTLEEIYPSVESISIDYGIMEKANNIYLVEGNFEWNDLGSWESVYQISDRDENGNATTGQVQMVDSGNSYVYTDEGVVAVIGLDDVIVVRDGNAVLVCRRDKAEDVKKVVDRLKADQKGQFL